MNDGGEGRVPGMGDGGVYINKKELLLTFEGLNHRFFYTLY